MMTSKLPQLGMDGVLCDRPQDGCFIGGKRNYARDSISKKETKMAHVMTNREVQSHTKKLVAQLLGQDSAVDDETAGKLKEFLKTKLSPGDHAQVCDMLEAAGEPDVEAQDDADTEPGVPPLPKVRLGGAAADAAFRSMYPGLAHVRIDTSGLPVPKRAAGQSSDVASFNAMFPASAKIRLA